MTQAIETTNLQKRYGDTHAVEGINLSIARGSVFGLLGPNGAGKTTTIRMLTTLIRPDGGSARVLGHDLVKEAAEVRAKVGVTGQFASVDEDLTGMQNLVMIGQLLDLNRAQARARADELLAEFDLTDAGKRLTKTYSGGRRRRLDLAASLIGRPDVVFLDEPTTGLDPAKRDDVWDMIRVLTGMGTTVLLTTQYLEEADALANEITVIDHGKIIAHDTPQGLKRQVGGQTLEVRPTNPADLERVRPLLAKVGTREPEQPAPDQLSVPVADDHALTTIVGELAREGISVSELSLRLPSLDEVFYSLTGTKQTADAEPSTSAPETQEGALAR